MIKRWRPTTRHKNPVRKALIRDRANRQRQKRKNENSVLHQTAAAKILVMRLPGSKTQKTTSLPSIKNERNRQN